MRYCQDLLPRDRNAGAHQLMDENIIHMSVSYRKQGYSVLHEIRMPLILVVLESLSFFNGVACWLIKTNRYHTVSD
jgi:hypothetical protein